MDINKILDLIWWSQVKNEAQMEKKFIELTDMTLFFDLWNEFEAGFSLVDLEYFIN